VSRPADVGRRNVASFVCVGGGNQGIERHGAKVTKPQTEGVTPTPSRTPTRRVAESRGGLTIGPGFEIETYEAGRPILPRVPAGPSASATPLGGA